MSTKLPKKSDLTEVFLPLRSVFQGDIVFEGDAQINGTVHGNVSSESGNIMCGAESVINGSVRGADIALFGAVNGDVTACGQLTVFTGARLTGNVIAAAVAIEKGAAYEGHITIKTSDQIGNDRKKGANITKPTQSGAHGMADQH